MDELKKWENQLRTSKSSLKDAKKRAKAAKMMAKAAKVDAKAAKMRAAAQNHEMGASRHPENSNKRMVEIAKSKRYMAKAKVLQTKANDLKANDLGFGLPSRAYAEKPTSDMDGQVEIGDSLPSLKKQVPIDHVLQSVLEQSVTLRVPQHVDNETWAEVFIEMKNEGKDELYNINVDLSDIKYFFKTEGDVFISMLRPGMQVEKTVRIRPRYDKGVFPTRIVITADGARIDHIYTIKVGGTEVY